MENSNGGLALREAVESFGALSSVAAYSYADTSHVHSGMRFERYEFTFQNGQLTITANASDDTIDIIFGPANAPERVELSQTKPWSRAIGTGLLWAWVLTNHQGYRDGVQLEFGTRSGFLTVHLMCEASSLTARCLEPIKHVRDTR